MKNKFVWIVLIIIFALTACQAENSPSTVKPTLEIINIQVTPASAQWMVAVTDCSSQIPDLGVYRQILPINELDLGAADLILRLGQKEEADPFVTVLGTEEIVVALGEEVPISSLSIESLRAIFKGVYTDWTQLPEAQETGTFGNQPIRTLSYPHGHELRTLFEATFLGSDAVASDPIVHYTNRTLESLLKEHPFAIGYTLNSQISPDIRTFSINSDNPQSGLQYVLAVTQQAPIGKLRDLLLCLQNTP